MDARQAKRVRSKTRPLWSRCRRSWGCGQPALHTARYGDCRPCRLSTCPTEGHLVHKPMRHDARMNLHPAPPCSWDPSDALARKGGDWFSAGGRGACLITNNAELFPPNPDQPLDRTLDTLLSFLITQKRQKERISAQEHNPDQRMRSHQSENPGHYQCAGLSGPPN